MRFVVRRPFHGSWCEHHSGRAYLRCGSSLELVASLATARPCTAIASRPLKNRQTLLRNARALNVIAAYYRHAVDLTPFPNLSSAAFSESGGLSLSGETYLPPISGIQPRLPHGLTRNPASSTQPFPQMERGHWRIPGVIWGAAADFLRRF
jgi:hypothetical protein